MHPGNKHIVFIKLLCYDILNKEFNTLIAMKELLGNTRNRLLTLKPVTKYFFGFMTITAISLVILLIGLISANMSEKRAEEINKNIFPKTMLLNRLERDITHIKFWLANISATRAARGFDEGIIEADSYYADGKQTLKKLLSLHKDEPANVRILNEIQTVFDAYYLTGIETAKAYIESGPTYGNEMLKVLTIVSKTLSTRLDSLLGEYNNNLTNGIADIYSSSLFMKRFFVMGGIIVFVLSAFVSYFLSVKFLQDEETYRTIFNGTDEAIIILDNETFRLIDCNTRLLDLLKTTKENVTGKTPDKFSSPEDGYTGDKAFEKIIEMKNKARVLFEWILKRSDGEKVWVEITLNNVIINGKKRVMGVLRDITDRKKSDVERERMLQQLTQAQKMEAVGSLAGGLAHDFNNILTGIMGSSSLVENMLNKGEMDTEGIRNYITIIKDASVKAAATVKRLLTLTKDTGLNFVPVDLNESLKNVVDICLNSFPKSVSIKIDYYDEPVVVNADLGALGQVLLNILVNASHAVTIMRQPGDKEGGMIHVKVDKISTDEAFCRSAVNAVCGLCYYSILIEDDGCGIDKKDIDKIFDPFFTTKSASGGNGLGLSMVYNLVKQHGGFIKVYSEQGVGSTFIVYIPEHKGEIKPRPLASTTEIKHNGRILIVDDEELVRLVARDILEYNGYEVKTASGGREGIEIFAGERDAIDVVLLDMSMPDLSGHDTLKELIKIRPGLKVIMSSGFGMDEKVQAAIKLGASSFIHKPYTNDQLLKAVGEVISPRA